MKTNLIDKHWKIHSFPNSEKAIDYAVLDFLKQAEKAIAKRGLFTVALSGGSTPKAIYSKLSHYSKKIPWNQVILFWSDERSVPPDHSNSNYKMAMDAGLNRLPIPHDNIFRMHAEEDIEISAMAYEHLIQEKTNGKLDFIMLGMGTDGHTASLFPKTKALKTKNRLVVSEYIPHLKTSRMTLTFPCINQARHIAIYVLGDSKKKMLEEVLYGKPHMFPIQEVGTPENPAYWITDQAL